MIKKTFIFRITGIILFVVGMTLRSMKIDGSMPVLLTGIGLLVIGYIIWLYATSTRKNINFNKDKEADVIDS